MSNAGWFAAKMAERQGQAPQRPMYQPQGQVPSQMYQPMQPVYQQPGQPPYQPMAPQHVGPAQAIDPNAFTRDHQGLMMAASTWAGGQGVRTETQHCPECHSQLFFSRANAGGNLVNSNTGQMITPAPICDTCGWNPAFPLQTGVTGAVPG